MTTYCFKSMNTEKRIVGSYTVFFKLCLIHRGRKYSALLWIITDYYLTVSKSIISPTHPPSQTENSSVGTAPGHDIKK